VRPLRFADVEKMTAVKTYDSLALTFHLKTKQPFFWRHAVLRFPRNTLDLPLSGFTGKQQTNAETIFRYLKRQTQAPVSPGDNRAPPELDAAEEGHDRALADAFGGKLFVQRIDRGREHEAEGDHDAQSCKPARARGTVGFDSRDEHSRLLREAMIAGDLADEWDVFPAMPMSSSGYGRHCWATRRTSGRCFSRWRDRCPARGGWSRC